jgi:hypothetical protein
LEFNDLFNISLVTKTILYQYTHIISLIRKKWETVTIIPMNRQFLKLMTKAKEKTSGRNMLKMSLGLSFHLKFWTHLDSNSLDGILMAKLILHTI